MVKITISYDENGKKITGMMQGIIARTANILRIKTQHTDKYDRIYIDIDDEPKKGVANKDRRRYNGSGQIKR